MIRSRFSLLGALVAAVGLMAVFASAAQAEGKWLVLTGVGTALYTDAEIEANKEKLEWSIENNSAALLSESLGVKLAIKCTAGELIDALLASAGNVKNGAKVKFTGCTILAGGTNGLLKEETACKVHTSTDPDGTLETEPVHGTLKLHTLANGEKHDTALILADAANEVLAVLLMGEGCVLPEETKITGALSVWDCSSEPNKTWLEHKTVHLITEFKSLTTLKVVGKPASVDGSVNIDLASGKSFAGSPG